MADEVDGQDPQANPNPEPQANPEPKPAPQPEAGKRDGGEPPKEFGSILTNKQEPEKKPEGEPEKKPEGGDQPKPEDFEIKIPEGAIADREAIDSLKALAKESGWTPEQQQKLADMHMQSLERAQAYQMAEGQKTLEKWREEIRNHPEFGGAKYERSIENAKLMLQKYGTPRLLDEYSRMGVLDHPDLFVMLNRMHADVSEGVSIGGDGEAGPEKGTAETLFPTMARK